jgi:HEAT repeat protein
MEQRGRIRLIVLIAVVLCGLGWIVVASLNSEPIYEGHPLSYWLQAMAASPVKRQDGLTSAEAFEAVRKIGTNAIPKLLGMLQAHDSRIKLALVALAKKQHFVEIRFTPAKTLINEAQNGFIAIGTRARPAIPDLIKIYDRTSSADSQRAISSIFYSLGPMASAAAPSLIQRLATTNEVVRNDAINSIGAIRGEPDTAVPALIKCLHDPFARNRMDAAYALGAYGTNANAAIPVLVELLRDSAVNSNASIPYVDIHIAAEFALRHINPEAALKAGLK